jgi:hypothetical protein
VAVLNGSTQAAVIILHSEGSMGWQHGMAGQGMAGHGMAGACSLTSSELQHAHDHSFEPCAQEVLSEAGCQKAQPRKRQPSQATLATKLDWSMGHIPSTLNKHARPSHAPSSHPTLIVNL